jgi:MFS family permease
MSRPTIPRAVAHTDSSTRTALISAWGLFAGLALLMIGNGLLGVLVGVRSELEGFNTTVTGVVLAAYFVGFLGGTQVTPRFMARVGHIRVFSGLAAAAAATALLHGLAVSALSWALLRLVFGFAMAGLYVVVESWLNELVSNANRGRVMAVYMLVSVGGLGLGQMMISLGDPLLNTLFIVAGTLMVLAIVPVSLSINAAPPFQLPPHAQYGELWRRAPLGVVTAVGSGMANGAIIAMASVFATQAGLSPVRIGLFVGVAAIGSMVLQWPIGHLSDRIGRRRTIILSSLGSLVAGIVALGLDPDSLALVGVMFVLGGLSYPLYSLALSHVVDVLPPGEAVTGSVAVVFLYGVGAIAGPIGASLAMDAFGPEGFFWSIATVYLAIGAYGVARVVGRPVIDKTVEPWLPIPARSTFVLRRNGRRRGRSTDSL